MKKIRLMIMMLAALMLSSTYAQAGDYAVGVKIGTLGPSLEVTTNIVPMFLNARIQGNKYTIESTSQGTDMTYDTTMDLSSLALIADVYPFAGKFRLSAGAYLNNNSFTLSAKPTATTFTINGVDYAVPNGSVDTEVTFDKLAPYFGLGWGDPVSSGMPFGFSLEFGVLMQGAPQASITTTGFTPPGTDIAAEEKKLQDDLSSFDLWPVASIGVNFSF